MRKKLFTFPIGPLFRYQFYATIISQSKADRYDNIVKYYNKIVNLNQNTNYLSSFMIRTAVPYAIISAAPCIT